MAGLLYNGSILLTSHFNAQQEIQQASAKSETRAQDARQGLIDIANVTFDTGGQRLWVNVTNNGSVTYNTSALDVFVDAAPRTADLVTKKVNDRTTNVWPPKTRLELVLDQTVAPTDVVVVAPTGTIDFWRA